MKWVAYHNGKEIPYLLGTVIGFDQWLGSLVPGSDIDKTISHRIGMKKLKIAIKRGLIDSALADGKGLSSYQRKVIGKMTIPFWKHPLQATIDLILEKIDKGHSAEAIGA